MKRTLADLFFLVSACCVILLAFAAYIVFFGVPNTVGLNRNSVLAFGSPAIDAFIESRELPILCGLSLFVGVPLAIMLIRYAQRLHSRVSSATFRLQRAPRTR